MSPLAHTLLCAVRYAHGRSLHPYLDVIEGVRQVWHLLDAKSQTQWLSLVEPQVRGDLCRMMDVADEGFMPVTRYELEAEFDAYLRLFEWCRACSTSSSKSPSSSSSTSSSPSSSTPSDGAASSGRREPPPRHVRSLP